MADTDSEALEFGKAHLKACTLVGQFMNSWALLESAMNTGIGELLGMGNIERIIATSNMQVRSKIHIFKTLINLMGAPEDWVRGSIKTLNAITTKSDHRNMVAHTPFGPHESGGVEFLVIRAKGKLTFPDTIWSEDEFKGHFREIEELRNELEKIVDRLHQVRVVAKAYDAMLKKEGAPEGLLNALLPQVEPQPDAPVADEGTPQRP